MLASIFICYKFLFFQFKNCILLFLYYYILSRQIVIKKKMEKKILYKLTKK